MKHNVVPKAETKVERKVQRKKKKQPTIGLIVVALIVSLIAALIGGTIWGFLVNVTGYDIGFMAWAVGVLCGFASIRAARVRGGVAFQVTAVVSSLVGILAGKYVMFFYIYRDALISVNGINAASKLNIFSGQVIRLFPGNVGAVVSWLDILWVGLAVFAAWEIPKDPRIKLTKESITVSSVRHVV